MVERIYGAFSEYVSIPASNCHKLSDAVSFEEASLMEPLAVAVHAVTLASLETDEDACILGSGAVGLMTLQVVNDIGAEKLFAIDTLEYRLDLAKKEDSVNEVLALGGVNSVFEAVGLQKTVQQTLSMVQKGGKVVIIGMLAAMMELDMLDVTVKEIEIRGSYGYTSKDFKQALTLITKGKVDVKPLITHVLPLYDIAKGFDMLSQGTEKVIKVVLKP